jgi:hypothetical protein
MGLFSRHTAPARPFPVPPPREFAEEIPAWWERPAPLTDEEIAFQRYLSSITWQLPRDRWYPTWDVGGNQVGVHTIRFFAAFSGYAAAAIGMRTPAYPGLTRRILLSAIEHVLDRRAWSYVELLWSDEPWFPDPAAHQNIMYTGHVLQLMALYEALSGDARFRTAGFDFVWSPARRFHYTVPSLADVTVRQMRESPSGGVPCEPGHVFFTCNDHAHVALRLLEGLGLGDWSAEHAKWQDFVLRSYYDETGGGAIKVVYNDLKDAFFPVGYAGMDGWAILWLVPWVSDPEVARNIWNIARDRVRWDMFDAPHVHDRTEIERGGDELELLYDIVHTIVPEIPTATFLYAAAAAVGDRETAGRLRAMIEDRLLAFGGGTVSFRAGPQFAIGSMANFALGLALENGSSMRWLVRRPLPRDWFAGPLVDDVQPDAAAVYEARREGRDLVVDVAGDAAPVRLVLRNVPSVRAVAGAAEGTWRWEEPTLVLTEPGRRVLRIVVGE